MKRSKKKSAKIYADELVTWDKEHIWHPFTQMQGWLETDPLIIDHAKGNYLYDVRGRKYLDAISSLWVTVHGHNHPRLNAAMFKQIKRVSHSTLLGAANVPSIQLAKKLIEKAPKGLKKVFYSDSGSTAVEVALKMAFQYWQQRRPLAEVSEPKKKTKFIALSDAYHGDTIGAVSLGGIELFHTLYQPLLFEKLQIPTPHDFVQSENLSLERAGNKALEIAKNVIEAHQDEVAALVIEPLMQGAAGMLRQPPGFLRHLAQFCRDAKIFLILDEVATGFGRTGKLFACEWEEVTPDFLCLAKGISGGYLPLAATLTTDEVYRGFLGEFSELKTFFHGHTYTGNPVACAAALASLELFEEKNFWRKLREKISLLAQELATLHDLSFIGDVRQCGFMVGIELVKSRQPWKRLDFSQRTGHRVCLRARQKGLLMRPLGDVLVLMPPLSISKREIKNMIRVLRESLQEILGRK